MAFELIAAIVASLAAAGMMMALRKIAGKRLPRWIVPVTAGLALFGYASDVILASRWTPNARLVSAFDCISGRRAEVARGKASVTEAGELLDLDWTSLPHDDVAIRALCRTP